MKCKEDSNILQTDKYPQATQYHGQRPSNDVASSKRTSMDIITVLRNRSNTIRCGQDSIEGASKNGPHQVNKEYERTHH